MQVTDILNAVYDDQVGWRATTTNIKPVHVANGLFRAVLGYQHAIDPLLTLVVWETNQRPVPGRETSALIERPEYASIGSDRRSFEQFRRQARAALNADSAAYRESRNSSLTVAHARMVSQDYADRGVGDFAAALLGEATDPAWLSRAIVEALERDRPDDPLTLAAWPLLAQCLRSERQRQPVPALALPHAAEIVARLREAAATLAQHEHGQGNQLRTLQRAVLFAIAALFAHAQAIAADADLERRRPLLLAPAGAGQQIEHESARSLDLLYREIERFLQRQLAERLRFGRALDSVEGRTPPITSTEQARVLLRELQERGRAPGPPALDLVRRRLAALDQAIAAHNGNVVAALARTLLDEHLAANIGGPRLFLQTIGHRAGLIYPYGGGSGEKRLRPSVAMLDVLVRSCVEPGEFVAYDDFLGRLWNRFGIVAGGRFVDGEDLHRLSSAGLRVDPRELGRTADLFATQLTAMGLARQFADGVTFVGDRS